MYRTAYDERQPIWKDPLNMNSFEEHPHFCDFVLSAIIQQSRTYLRRNIVSVRVVMLGSDTMRFIYVWRLLLCVSNDECAMVLLVIVALGCVALSYVGSFFSFCFLQSALLLRVVLTTMLARGTLAHRALGDLLAYFLRQRCIIGACWGRRCSKRRAMLLRGWWVVLFSLRLCHAPYEQINCLLQRVFRKIRTIAWGCFKGALQRSSFHWQGTFKEHSGNILWTFTERKFSANRFAANEISKITLTRHNGPGNSNKVFNTYYESFSILILNWGCCEFKFCIL